MHRSKLLAAIAVMLVSAAHAEIVVIGNPAAPAMSKDEIAQFFLGKNQAMKPVDQPNSQPIKAEFYQRLSGRDLSQIKAIWARLIFTGAAPPPKEVADAAAVKKAVTEDPKAIGYIEGSAVDGTVKVLLTLN